MLRFKEIRVIGCLLLILAIASGCGSGGGGGTVSTTTITGSVKFEGVNQVNTNVYLFKYISELSKYQQADLDQTTDPEGNFSFTGVTAGNYYIRVDIQNEPPYLTSYYYTGDNATSLTIVVQQSYNLNIELEIDDDVPPPPPVED